MVQLSSVLISVIVVGMVVTGAAFFIREQADVHNTANVDTGFNSTFNHVNNMTETTEDIRVKLQSANLVSAEGFAALFSGSFGVLRVVLGVVFLPISIMTDLGTSLGLPSWFATGISSIIVLLVAFAIANIIFGRGRA